MNELDRVFREEHRRIWHIIARERPSHVCYNYNIKNPEACILADAVIGGDWTLDDAVYRSLYLAEEVVIHAFKNEH